MSLIEELPQHVIEMMSSSSIAGYSTITAVGTPIDTPILFFPGQELRTLDFATGLSYPAKAERARRNPRVGMLLEGSPNEPVISISGIAAVRDADLQANALRYLSEAAHILPHNPDWSLARQAVWYWTRILVEVTPSRIRWWDSPADMDKPPQSWSAPDGTSYAKSDPAPPGKTSAPAKWAEKPWQELAAQALARQVPGHLSVVDGEGFPLPIRARAVALTDTGFTLDIPAGVPWPISGPACLTFGGVETFLGEVTPRHGKAEILVNRTLPIFPMNEDTRQLWEPTADTREQLMRRLLEETERRGQSIPTIPLERPEPSESYKRRMRRAQEIEKISP